MKEAEKKIEKSEQETKSVRSSRAVVALLCMFVPRTHVRECVKICAKYILYTLYIYIYEYMKKIYMYILYIIYIS